MPTTVTAGHLRDLLDSKDPDAALVLVGGAPTLASNPSDDDLVIVTRDELTASLPKGRDAGDTDLEFQAANLESIVDSLGG
ncbi:hypothetical protein DW322_19910 [Rhodococcus rhodnii]|uniref:Uncharacterized protein n=1 Tax=Rhodococcus rhodnii TaxID=38312 RepID=A0A6P2CM71_9NOCA|nr:hypothetical protein DW322_19910 [Rhodococcus rhodnii]